MTSKAGPIGHNQGPEFEITDADWQSQERQAADSAQSPEEIEAQQAALEQGAVETSLPKGEIDPFMAAVVFNATQVRAGDRINLLAAITMADAPAFRDSELRLSGPARCAFAAIVIRTLVDPAAPGSLDELSAVLGYSESTMMDALKECRAASLLMTARRATSETEARAIAHHVVTPLGYEIASGLCNEMKRRFKHKLTAFPRPEAEAEEKLAPPNLVEEGAHRGGFLGFGKSNLTGVNSTPVSNLTGVNSTPVSNFVVTALAGLGPDQASERAEVLAWAREELAACIERRIGGDLVGWIRARFAKGFEPWRQRRRRRDDGVTIRKNRFGVLEF